MGVSRGHWEGNTLVVEVTNFTNNFDNNWVIGAHRRNARRPRGIADDRPRHLRTAISYSVTERFTPIDANTIHYEAKVDGRKGVHAAVDRRVLRDWRARPRTTCRSSMPASKATRRTCC